MPHSYQELRKSYPEFIYESFEINETDCEIKVVFHFEIKGLSTFAPCWTLPKKVKKTFGNDRIFKELIFSLGMTELVSYWKIACPPVVKVLCGRLDERQIGFWKELYFSGLGEFFYRNGIEAGRDDFMKIESLGEAQTGASEAVSDNEKCLISIGGGKDSIVSLEVLKSNSEDNFCYIINPRGATVKSAETAGYGEEKIVSFYRTLDKNMLELNKQGFLNGHTPFSAIVAFSSVTAAYMNGIKYVVLSNEASANESTVKDSEVNHQYSKSFKFEKDFHEYQDSFIGSGVYYFSLLRPMSELQIAEYFAKQKKYHGIFRSCNAGSKEDKWCGKCSKCLFVSLILSPFLTVSEIEKIFGANLLDDENMEGFFRQLIGLTPEKPFECVGSRNEINTAVSAAIKRLEAENAPLPYLFRVYRQTELYEDYKDRENCYEGFFDSENLLPESFRKLLLAECYGDKN